MDDPWARLTPQELDAANRLSAQLERDHHHQESSPPGILEAVFGFVPSIAFLERPPRDGHTASLQPDLGAGPHPGWWGSALVPSSRSRRQAPRCLCEADRGTGKSVLGLQLALTLADSLGGDVACASIEILPVEVEAQLAGFDTPRLVRLVLAPPFPKVEAESAKARLFAAVIDAGLSQQAASGLEEAILSLLSAVHEANGKPRVLLLDCLSDGYGLGASAPASYAMGYASWLPSAGFFLCYWRKPPALRPLAGASPSTPSWN